MSSLRLRTWQLGIKSLLVRPLLGWLLTVLGTLFAVASVICAVSLLAIGEGISRKAQEQIESLGANNIIVRSIRPPADARQAAGPHTATPCTLTRDDYDRLVETIPAIDKALPIRELWQRFSYRGRSVEGRLVGCTPEYAEVNRLEVERGRFLGEMELREKQNACVLAAGMAERLFASEDLIGSAIRIEDDYYVVVGVMKRRSPTVGISASLSDWDLNQEVYVPISTFGTRIGDGISGPREGADQGAQATLAQITLIVDKIENVMPTAELVKETLARRHGKEDYTVVVPLELLDQARSTRTTFIVFGILAGLIAAVSLVAVAIGIVIIVLASLTGRTGENGSRRA